MSRYVRDNTATTQARNHTREITVCDLTVSHSLISREIMKKSEKITGNLLECI